MQGRKKQTDKRNNLLTFGVHFCRQCKQQENKKCDWVHVKNYIEFPRCGRSWKSKTPLATSHELIEASVWNRIHQKTENDDKTDEC